MPHPHSNPSLFFLFEIQKIDEQHDRDLIREVQKVFQENFESRILRDSYFEDDPHPARSHKREACWTCGGDPESHPSGRTCICGDGSHESEVANLRKLADERMEGMGNEKDHKKDACDEKWNPQWLRGYLIDIFNLEPTADNWNILEAVRMDGIHWRQAIFKIQTILGLESADGPMTVNAVRERLQSGDLKKKLHELREENARLRGVIEGMGNR